MLLLKSTRMSQAGITEVDWAFPRNNNLVLAVVPSIGMRNLATGRDPDEGGSRIYSPSQTGIAQSGGTYGYPGFLRIDGGITLFSIWSPRTEDGYLFAGSSGTILSTRNASNRGWSWSRGGLVDGNIATRGREIGQRLTVQGVAAYTEANQIISSFFDTVVAVRVTQPSRTISWFANGRKSSPDIAIASNGSNGDSLTVGQSGPYTGGVASFIDKFSLLLGFSGSMTDDEIADTSANPWKHFR